MIEVLSIGIGIGIVVTLASWSYAYLLGRRVRAECVALWKARFPNPMVVERSRRLTQEDGTVQTATEVSAVRDGGEAYVLIRELPPEEYKLHFLELGSSSE